MAIEISTTYRNRMRVHDPEGFFLFEYYINYTSREKQMRGWAGWHIPGVAYAVSSCDIRTQVVEA